MTIDVLSSKPAGGADPATDRCEPASTLRALIGQDADRDVELILAALREGGREVEWGRIRDARGLAEALRAERWDVALCDFRLDRLTSFDALGVLDDSGTGVPLVVVSGPIGEQSAAACVRHGAADVVRREDLATLPAVVHARVRDARERGARRCPESPAAPFDSAVEQPPTGVAMTDHDAEAERARLAAVVGASAIAIMSFDADGMIDTWNAGAERLYGYTALEAIGRPGVSLLAADPQARDARLARIMTARTAERFEGRDVRKDGSFIDVAVTDSPIVDRGGHTVGVARIVEDITARRRAEAALGESVERWRALLAAVDEMVVLADPDGKVTYVSPAVERWLKYDASVLVGVDLSSLTHPEDQEALTRAVTEAKPGHPSSLRRRVQAGDGSWHWVDSRVVRLDETLAGSALLISQDVTEQVEFERERERTELDRRVSQRLEAVGQLAAGIAHEINTPLQFVGDSVSFLHTAVDELLILVGLYRESLYSPVAIPMEARQDQMKEAEDNADVDFLLEEIPPAFARTADGIARVRTIVHAMKSFSHAVATEVAPADLGEAVELTLEVCRNEYKYVADVTIDRGEMPMVTCNVGEINQVLLNLVINAAQAIGEQVGDSGERGQITISTGVEDEFAVIRIADDGPGIPQEIQDRIYEPFFTTKEVGKGTGQGLALARATVNRHGGSLECVSALGEGATFTIRLPLTGNTNDSAQEALQ